MARDYELREEELAQQELGSFVAGLRNWIMDLESQGEELDETIEEFPKWRIVRISSMKAESDDIQFMIENAQITIDEALELIDKIGNQTRQGLIEQMCKLDFEQFTGSNEHHHLYPADALVHLYKAIGYMTGNY